MLNQNLSSFMYFPFQQPQNLSSLSTSFEKLEISKPLDKKKDEYLKTIRSQKRNLRLRNKRLGAVNSLSSQLGNMHIQEDPFANGVSIEDYISQCLTQTFTCEQINELAGYLNSQSRYGQHLGAIGLRKLLSIEDNPPIQAIIDTDVVPRLVELLIREDEKQLQLEASWSLSHLSSGTTEQTRTIVDNGAIPALVKLLGSQNNNVQMQAVCTLGNIAGDTADFRNTILLAGALSPVITIVELAIYTGNIHFIKQGTWAIANFCRGRPLPPYREIQKAISFFAEVIKSQEDLEILTNAFVAISCLSDGEYERIQEVLDSGIVPFVLKYMNHHYLTIANPCLKIIGNICTGNNQQVDMLLRVPGMMEKMFTALKHQKQAIRLETAWTLSNITAGTSAHIESIVGNADFLDQLFYTGRNDTLEVRREIGWTLNNALKRANHEQLRTLFEKGIIEHFGKLIEEDGDVRIKEIGLKGIRDILNMEAYRAFCWAVLEESNILSKIEELQNHSSSNIAEVVFQILDFADHVSKSQEEMY